MIPVESVGDATTLAELTTMRVGGRAKRVLVAHDTAQLVEFANELWDEGEPWLLVGGGSNTVVADEGYPGTLLLVRGAGIEQVDSAEFGEGSGRVRLRVQAGHDWDELVAACVERGLAGLEALSGIPGRVGAAPVQNIGAYGAELSDVLYSIEFLDAETGEVETLSAADLELGYRDSVIKRGREGVVLSIDIVLADGSPRGRHGEVAGSDSGSGSGTGEPLSAPIAYAQLAQALGVELGARVPIDVVRREVLRLRASKGMVLDDADHDSWSAGSFFTNPIVTESFARTLPEGAPRFPQATRESEPAVTSFEELASGVPMRVPASSAAPSVKLSAAWLIEQSGVPRGYRLPGSGAAVSSRHTLAITNRGAATAADVGELARFIVQRVQQEFGVLLVPEPILYGIEI